MSGTTTFTRVRSLGVGYSALEDRLYVRLDLPESRLATWVPRRVAAALFRRVTEMLRRTHPVAEDGTAAFEPVLQLEHMAALSERAAQRDGPAGADAEGVDAAGSDEPAPFGGHYLVSDFRVEPQGDALVIGLLGQALSAEAGRPADPQPLAAASLSRTQAHELLHMLREQIEQVEWGLGHVTGWTDGWAQETA